MIPFLSEEIIINILKRLPAKSLIRFQCVCKYWKNLTKKPSFIADHLNHSTHQNPCLIVQPSNGIWYRDPLNLHLLDCEMQVRRVTNHPLIDYLHCGWVVGSSNGLLCVDTSKDGRSYHSLLLYNPAIREVRLVLPRYTGFRSFLGFGFSPIVNDYKIVRIHVDQMSHASVEKVEVYSLSTGSWKGVEFGILSGAYITPDSCTANGAIFWLGFKREGKDLEDRTDYPVIISFDIAMEVFILMPRPTSPPTFRSYILTTYENKLAMLSYPKVEDSEYLIDLWVMEEGDVASGERYSWTKKYSGYPYQCFLVPVTIWRNEIVCVTFTGGAMENDEPNTTFLNLVFINLTTDECKEFVVRCKSYSHDTFNYVESLVPVGGMKLTATSV